jgi:hypothetical protein
VEPFGAFLVLASDEELVRIARLRADALSPKSLEARVRQ